ncbi:hypothetical protein HMPREF1531_02140 [Propionibacterium sp. oral taxon 192 str. F0372]|uniref:cytochrome P450 n=1 Tax=Propionibacterium sp. oral taxon 192 TaxID=671222 RepID=UPI0003537BC2|nr:cytochrome P450 [Propionibacterium sp. oral taxon 192]EPH02828.1 hypothetical protein HMPREF1531_02140 [Propionibacterium sp. oral taxon 192 str. F0372]
MTDTLPIIDFSGADERALTDALRPDNAVVRNSKGEWILLRHRDVVAAATDDITFSSAVSAHQQIPNGLDGEKHTAARALIDAYLSADALAPHAASFEKIAHDMVASLPKGEPFDAVNELGAHFAVRAMTAWLGWPQEMEPRLLDWVQENNDATRSGDRKRTAQVAADFDAMIREVLEPRMTGSGHNDVTAQLVADRSLGRELSETELVSILRNWTGGDLSSMALCVGCVVDFLARAPHIQERLRSKDASDEEIDAIIDEILRIDDPFVTNRRRTTCPVNLDGIEIGTGEIVRLNWTSANRDEQRFGDPAAFDPEKNRPHNLVYGIGRHACPGRLLSTMELRAVVKALMNDRSTLSIAPKMTGEREISPVGGYRQVWVVLG